MDKTSDQEVETYVGQEGKTYEYQGSQGSERGDDASVAAKRQQLINAFEQFVDALVGTYQAGGSGGQAGAGSQGSTGDQGDSGGQGTSGQPSYQGAPSMGSGAAGSQGGEAFEVSLPALRESYRQDRAREMARASESARETPTSVPTDKDSGNKHMSDSNKAPLADMQEFAPSYGNRGRSQSASMEVVAVPSHERARPETAPAPPATIGAPLDAYWGSFGTAIDRARERMKIAAKQTSEVHHVEELIIGTVDSRRLVTNNETYPWRCICSLLITAQSGSLFIGTGWLVSPRLVLTAGHCVYLHDEGGWASQIEVIPGRNGGSRPFGSVVARDLRSVRGWTIDRDRDYDYGAILLPEGRRYGDELGWLGYATRADDYFSGITLNLAGYPGDGGKEGPERQQGTQWYDSREVKDVDEKQITYEIDTWGGQSGAPVWVLTSDGNRYGLAIHTWGTTVSNGATRITGDVFDNIVLWAGQVP